MTGKLLSLILVMSFCNLTASAQSKPKRDTSKDNSVIAAQRKSQEKRKAEVEVKKRKENISQVPKRSANSTSLLKKATYLTVNEMSSISRYYPSQEGSETFRINTDRKNWEIRYLPEWCRILRIQNGFVLSYTNNNSTKERHGWFQIVADGQSVGIDIKQIGSKLNVVSKVVKASIDHNSYGNTGAALSRATERYMKINANVTFYGARGQKCLVVAFVEEEEGNKRIKASRGYPDYGTKDLNDVYAATEIIPTTDEAQTFDVPIYLPNNAMQLYEKNNKLQCRIFVYCEATSSYVTQYPYTIFFKAKMKKGNVTTKK